MSFSQQQIKLSGSSINFFHYLIHQTCAIFLTADSESNYDKYITYICTFF